MPYYLVHARPRRDLLPRLGDLLAQNAFLHLRPFGRAVTHALTNARIGEDGRAVWEEEDYCSPPLAQERAAVLDEYFDDITVERVEPGEGWRRIADLPSLVAGQAR